MLGSWVLDWTPSQTLNPKPENHKPQRTVSFASRHASNVVEAMNLEGRAALLPGRRQLLGLRPTLLQGWLHQMASCSTSDAPMEICWLDDPCDSRVLWPGCFLGIVNQVAYLLPFFCVSISVCHGWFRKHAFVLLYSMLPAILVGNRTSPAAVHIGPLVPCQNLTHLLLKAVLQHSMRAAWSTAAITFQEVRQFPQQWHGPTPARPASRSTFHLIQFLQLVAPNRRRHRAKKGMTFRRLQMQICNVQRRHQLAPGAKGEWSSHNLQWPTCSLGCWRNRPNVVKRTRKGIAGWWKEMKAQRSKWKENYGLKSQPNWQGRERNNGCWWENTTFMWRMCGGACKSGCLIHSNSIFNLNSDKRTFHIGWMSKWLSRNQACSQC